MRKPRIAIYSAGIVGLGHMRRHLLIAQALAGWRSDLATLMTAEARQAGAFAMPQGVDCLILPALCKGEDKRMRPRYLDISLAEMVKLRSGTIRAAMEAFEPDVLIVDLVPGGRAGELDATLEYLKCQGRTRCVLGLRDVLDEPDAADMHWSITNDAEAICNYYDDIWIYGDPMIYDLIREYNFPNNLAARATYTGYLDAQLRLKFADAGIHGLAARQMPPGKLALCLVGGGQDDAMLAEAFAQSQLPPDYHGVLITGPYMPAPVQGRLHDCAAANPRLRVLDFLPEPAVLIDRADRVIAMGGYNTVCEVLSFQKQALIVPRVQPRLEQWIRAQRLLDVLHPHDLSPHAISAWLASPDCRPPCARELMDFGGLDRLPILLDEILSNPSPARP